MHNLVSFRKPDAVTGFRRNKKTQKNIYNGEEVMESHVLTGHIKKIRPHPSELFVFGKELDNRN